VALILLGAVIWYYWSTIIDMMEVWRLDENYSAGQIVPFAALWLLWHSRSSLRKCNVEVCWWGIAVIGLAFLARLFGVVFAYGSIERYSLVLTIAGVVLLVAGREVFYAARWVLLFLALMVPFPHRVHNLISPTLQDFATSVAAFCLDFMDATVVQEGNVIVINDDARLGVEEACNGLHMLTAFMIVAAVLIYLVTAPRWQKIVLLVSSIPVAIFCNLVRLVITAQLFVFTSDKIAEKFFHDFAGLAMMPLAIAVLIGEWFLLRSFTNMQDQTTTVPSGSGSHARRKRRRE